jgi:hypothetical protein
LTKRKGSKKLGHTKDLVGCDGEFLKAWLNVQSFAKGYLDFDAKNYDGKKYHIDHKVPVDAFNLKCSYHQKLCFHWSNLQPLLATENLEKSNKIGAQYGA